jgi:dienelactone hydrolase
VRVPAEAALLDADRVVPESAKAVILFAHGSGSSRHSSRNRFVAEVLQNAGFATLLLDLLTPTEEAEDRASGPLRFDISLLARRLVAAAEWLHTEETTRHLPIGCFGASTGGGAALVAAAARPDLIRTVVSRGGRPDLAGEALSKVHTPTLLIVGGRDGPVIGWNQEALAQLRSAGAEARLEIVHGATHLFEEPGALEEVARLALMWFDLHRVPFTGPAVGGS